MSARFALRALRFSAAARPVAIPARGRAFFHGSACRQATEVPPSTDPREDPRVREIANKIQNCEPAREAMIKLSQLMRDKGVDFSKPPSMSMMLKLGMDKDIREAGQNLMLALKDAGIEITPETAQQIMGGLKKE